MQQYFPIQENALQSGHDKAVAKNHNANWNRKMSELLPLQYPQLTIELRPSAMLPGEIGLFAVGHFRSRSIIVAAEAFSEDVAISWEQWKQLAPATRRKLFAFCPGDTHGIFAPSNINRLSTPWYCNHSCDPNAVFDTTGNLVAIKYVRAGTEITWDYATLEKNPRFRMACKCGSQNCRRIIRAVKAVTVKGARLE